MQLGPSRLWIGPKTPCMTVPSPANAPPAHGASTAAAAEIQLARPKATVVMSHRSNPNCLEVELVHPAATTSPLELEQYDGGPTSAQVIEMELTDPAAKAAPHGSSPISPIEMELVRLEAKTTTTKLRACKVPSPRSCPRLLRPILTTATITVNHHHHHHTTRSLPFVLLHLCRLS